MSVSTTEPTSIPPPPGFAIRGNVPVDEHILRVGVNYKFTNCIFLFGC
jgi:hypothetical protein